MDQFVTISSPKLSAEINLVGAELWQLRDEKGRDLLWGGDATFWTGRAPILFPCVGASRDEKVRIDGKSYAMERHGFARSQPFTVIELTESRVRLRLDANDRTRRQYPFDFRLDMIFSIVGSRLDMKAEVTNRDGRTMPASFGWHPAFLWPLPYGGKRGDHLMRFSKAEPATLRVIDGAGLIKEDAKPSPLSGRDLHLKDELFVTDALVWDRLQSRRIRYGAPGRRGLDVTFPGMSMLGIWTKPGAGYVCIEPWAGHADFSRAKGELKERAGIHLFAPGEKKTYRMSVDVTAGPVV